ncbi:MAG TPA: hypothetical protein VJ596_10165 [Gemmatimonadaceae bacterium]|nr:hypothetical protein [Gemmatimonadaceae bacterium]
MTIDSILSASHATAEFKADLRAFAAGRSVERIRTVRRSPPVKVMRLLAQLLAAAPELIVEEVEISARSGCSDFIGTVLVTTPYGERGFEFVWDCRWRTEQEGWTDCFGFPDQIRAA